MKILIGCTGFKSNLFSSLELANRLRENNHDVVFAAPADASPWIEHCGFDRFVSLHPRTGVLTAYDQPFKGKARSLSAWRQRVRDSVRKAKEEGFGKILDDVRPDVVLLDCEHHAAIIQTVAAKYPLGLLSFMYLTPPSAKKPPLNSNILPDDGWKGGSWFIRAKWLQHWLLLKRMRLKSATTFWGANSAAAHRSLAKELGVNLSKFTTAHGFQAPWSYQLPTMFLLAGNVDFKARLWPGQTFAGPMVLRQRPQGEPHQACEDFLGVSAERKIFVAFGTVRKPPHHFFEKLAAVARRRKTWRFLIATSEHSAGSASDLPANMAVVPWAPQPELLDVADCAIFHGGAGTLNECIVAGVPMIIYPNGLDGSGNGARVDYHGLGKLADFADSPEKIDADLSDVFSNKSFKSKMAHLSSLLDKYDDVPEDFLAELTGKM